MAKASGVQTVSSQFQSPPPPWEDWQKLQAWIDGLNYAAKTAIARFLAGIGVTTSASTVATKLRRSGGTLVYSGARRQYTSKPNCMEIIGDLMRRKSTMLSACLNARGLIKYYDRNKRLIDANCDKDNAKFLANLVKFFKAVIPYLIRLETQLDLRKQTY